MLLNEPLQMHRCPFVAMHDPYRTIGGAGLEKPWALDERLV